MPGFHLNIPRLQSFHDAFTGLAGWALVWRRDLVVRINGRRHGLGLRVLRHRDEIRIGDGDPVFYSTETLPVVIPFPGAGEPVFCTRCQLALEPGQPVVRCPGERCGGGYYYHAQEGQRDCFNYGPCLVCGYEPTGQTTFQWTPTEVYA